MDAYKELIETSERVTPIRQWISEHLEELQLLGTSFPGGMTQLQMATRFNRDTGEVVGVSIKICLGQFPKEKA